MKDERLKEMKNDYENIRIPKELRQRVEETICQAKEDKQEELKMKNKNRKLVVLKRSLGGAVAAMAAITIMANSGMTVAHAMYQVPILGAVAEIVTFREYESSTNQMEANVKIPEVTVKNEDGSVNEAGTQQLSKSIEEYTNEIIERFESDVEASDGEGLMEVQVDYSVATDNARLFSLRFDNLTIMAGGDESVKIYHIDKQSGEMIGLSDIFKEGVDYVAPISENIKEQMRAQMAEDDMLTYWVDDFEVEEWNFTSISEDTDFYVNEAGNLVIVFDEYEVAPGYMGVVEFEIPSEVTQDLVQEGFLG